MTPFQGATLRNTISSSSNFQSIPFQSIIFSQKHNIRKVFGFYSSLTLSLVLFQIDLPSILINNIQFFIINHNIINVSLHPQFIVQIKSITSSWSFPPINPLNNQNHHLKYVLYFIKYSKTHLIFANNLPKHFWISISSYLSLHMTVVFVSLICRTIRLISYYNQSLLNNRN